MAGIATFSEPMTATEFAAAASQVTGSADAALASAEAVGTGSTLAETVWEIATNPFLLGAITVAGVAGAGYAGYRYFKGSQANSAPSPEALPQAQANAVLNEELKPEPVEEPQPIQPEQAKKDSLLILPGDSRFHQPLILSI